MKKSIIAISLVLCLTLAAFGFAAWSTTLELEGSVNAAGTWDVQFIDVTFDATASKGAADVTAATDALLATPATSLELPTATLGYPGAGARFMVTVKNNGTVPATLTAAPTDVTGTDINITYGLDAVETMAPGATCTFSVELVWNSTSTVTAASQNYSIELIYNQDTTAYTIIPAHTNTNA